ncbi:type II toxin-antitoxin system PemK/MazF family toxin [Chlorobium limicola]|uniref:mRNA interferase n=1 Tax=Chlorobium limicola TaxID=1092 RepID=A0A101JNQ0_CHLLI|nr:type II toxin-antitoxin system PemK/MazF family toxin [Chlorobium limicola]KUL30154.1 MazF family transcriptional regulator [Chlorobium limicola]
MTGILRGDIRWADLNPTRGNEQSGLRPILVVSHDVFNDRSGTVIAIALTSQPQKAGFPLTMPIESAALPKKSWVKNSQIRTLSTERIGSRIGKLSAEELIRVIEGLNKIIGR